MRVTAIDGSKPPLRKRVGRAIIIKAPFLLMIASFLLGSFGRIAEHFAVAPFLASLLTLLSFIAAQQDIERGEPPFYDRWLKTTVVGRGESGQLSRRGFDVIPK